MNDSKAQILKTALVLFLQKGYKGVTMNEIVKNSGFSKGAFYHYFKSKEEVFEAVIKKFYHSILYIDYNAIPADNLQTFYKTIFEYKKNAKIKMTQWFESCFEGIVFDNNFFYLLFDAVRLFPNFKEMQQQFLKEEIGAWTNAIELAQQRGEIISKSTPEMLAKTFVYCSDGIALHKIMTSNWENDELIATEFISMWDAIYQSVKIDE